MQNETHSGNHEHQEQGRKRKGSEHRDGDASAKIRRIDASTIPSPSSTSPDYSQQSLAAPQFYGGRNFDISGGQFYNTAGNVIQYHIHSLPPPGGEMTSSQVSAPQDVWRTVSHMNGLESGTQAVQSAMTEQRPEMGLAPSRLDPPPPPTTIYGRNSDLEAVIAIIHDNKHPVIHGLGGIGKSSLARNILADSRI